MSIRFLDPAESQRVRDGINNDREFKLAAKFMSEDICLGVGNSKCIVRVRDGAVTDINLSPTPFDPWSFSIKGPVESWENFLQPLPPPFFNGIYSGMIRGKFEVAGNLEAAFAHFRAVARMFDVVRELQNG